MTKKEFRIQYAIGTLWNDFKLVYYYRAGKNGFTRIPFPITSYRAWYAYRMSKDAMYHLVRIQIKGHLIPTKVPKHLLEPSAADKLLKWIEDQLD